MKNTARRYEIKDATPGFAIRLTNDTELGGAILVAENSTGKGYRPWAQVISIDEAIEIANNSLKYGERMNNTDLVVWAYGVDGDYNVAARIFNRNGRYEAEIIN
jgi:hypothetical protein